ncbi:AraC family transcriptional regulator, partial [Staphylococcus aureus]
MTDIGTLLESGLPVDADRAALLLESFIFELHQTNEYPLSLHNPSIQKETVRAVMEDISKNVYGIWNETEVWTRNNISRSTLRRIVRHNTGYPLNDYVTRLKIAEAKKLL